MSVTLRPDLGTRAPRADRGPRCSPTWRRWRSGSLRADVMRSLLTMLGVVVGVATVVAMASIIQGFNQQVETSFASFGSNVIYIRKLRPGLFSPDLVDTVKRRPAFTVEDAKALRRLCPDVREVAIIGFQENLTLSYRGRTTRGVQVIGADPAVQEVNAYDPWLGRFFTPEEVRRSARCVVLGRDIREAVMPGGEPVGKIMHLQSHPVPRRRRAGAEGEGAVLQPRRDPDDSVHHARQVLPAAARRLVLHPQARRVLPERGRDRARAHRRRRRRDQRGAAPAPRRAGARARQLRRVHRGGA